MPGSAFVPPRRENILAVVVTYHPPPNVAHLLTAIHPQVGGIVVIDNASPDLASLEETVRSLPGIVLVRNSTNIGQASALNQGCELARERGVEWVLFFDQDTLPLPNLVDALIAAADAHPCPQRIGMLGSNHYDEQGAIVHPMADNVPFRDIDFVITSGSLLPLRVFHQVGPFLDGLFIDWVDIEYGWRLKRHHLTSTIAHTPGMRHMWGAPRRFRFVGIDLMVANHAPLRRYFIARNGVYLATRHFFRLPKQCLRALWSVATNLGVGLIVESDRLRKGRAALVGILHGLLGRLGPAPRFLT